MSKLHRREGEGFVPLSDDELAAYVELVASIRDGLGVPEDPDAPVLHSVQTYLAEIPSEPAEEGSDPQPPRHEVRSVKAILSEAEITDYFQRIIDAAVIRPEQVNAERARRILAGITINGVYVTGDDINRANLSDLAFGASLRIAAGDSTTPTTFRDGNNVDHDLTPVQLLGIWQQTAAHVSLLYAKSWELKAMDPIPTDYTEDSYWQ